jgi:RimJ/RimL family protein N-acetyltransferase
MTGEPAGRDRAGADHLPAHAVPPGVTIRPAVPRDARSFLELYRTVAEEGRYIRTERVTLSPRRCRHRFRRSWTEAEANLLAIADDRVVGSIGLRRDDHPVTSHVATLGMHVAPTWRGRGIGAALMTEALRWARWAGVEKLELSVYPHNVAAVGLYRRFGFAEEGTLVRHSKKSYGYEDELLMGLWLGGRD